MRLILDGTFRNYISFHLQCGFPNHNCLYVIVSAIGEGVREFDGEIACLVHHPNRALEEVYIKRLVHIFPEESMKAHKQHHARKTIGYPQGGQYTCTKLTQNGPGRC